MTKLKLSLFLNKDQHKSGTFKFVGTFNDEQINEFEEFIKGYTDIKVYLQFGTDLYKVGTMHRRIVKSVKTPYNDTLPLKHIRYQPKNATRAHNIENFILLYEQGTISINELYTYANKIASLYNNEVFLEVLNHNSEQLKNFYSYLDLWVKAFNKRGVNKVFFKTFMEDYIVKTQEALIDEALAKAEPFELKELKLYGLHRPVAFIQDHVKTAAAHADAEDGWYMHTPYNYQTLDTDCTIPDVYNNDTGWGRKPVKFVSHHRDKELSECLTWLKNHNEVLDYTWCEKHQDWFYDPDKQGQCPACADEARAEEKAQITELSPWNTHIYKNVDVKPKNSFNEVVDTIEKALDKSTIYQYGKAWNYSNPYGGKPTYTPRPLGPKPEVIWCSTEQSPVVETRKHHDYRTDFFRSYIYKDGEYAGVVKTSKFIGTFEKTEAARLSESRTTSLKEVPVTEAIWHYDATGDLVSCRVTDYED